MAIDPHSRSRRGHLRSTLRAARKAAWSCPALQDICLQQRNTSAELQTLVECLYAAGVLTPAELAARRQRRLGLFRVRSLLEQPTAARQLAKALGLQSVCQLSATCSQVAANFQAVLFPTGDPPALQEERQLTACRNLGIVGPSPTVAKEEERQQPRSVFTLRFFSWPFSSSQQASATDTASTAPPESAATESVSSSEVQTPPTEEVREPADELSCNAEQPTASPAGSEPVAKPEGCQESGLDEVSDAKPLGESPEREAALMFSAGQPPELVIRRLLGNGDVASLLAVNKTAAETATKEEEDATPKSSDDAHPSIARHLETLADYNTEVTESCRDVEVMMLDQLSNHQEETKKAAGEEASPAGSAEATSTTLQPVPEQEPPAPAPTTPARGGTARFFGRMLGYGSSSGTTEGKAVIEWAPPHLEASLLSIHQIARSIGKAAGLTAARHMSQTSKTASEGLHSFLTDLKDDFPYIYVCGGSCGIAVDSAERYCPQTGEWESLPPMCVPRRACAATSLGGRFFVMGGVDVPRFNTSVYSDSLQQPWVFENKYRPECFDPVANAWELLPPMSRPYTHATAVAAGGLLYVFGGLSFGSVLDQAQRLDPVKCQWEVLEPMPTPRFECAAAAAKGELYVLGGANPCGEPLAAAECFSPATGHWRSLPRMAEARYGCAAASARGRIFVIGGHGIWENLASVEAFDPQVGRWNPLQPLSARRNHCGASVAGGKIYVFGGHTNGQDIITIECLDPDSGGWEVAALMARPRSHCMTATVQP